jgi:hypothetical protein
MVNWVGAQPAIPGGTYKRAVVKPTCVCRLRALRQYGVPLRLQAAFSRRFLPSKAKLRSMMLAAEHHGRGPRTGHQRPVA